MEQESIELFDILEGQEVASDWQIESTEKQQIDK